jgi:hypothetical protein
MIYFANVAGWVERSETHQLRRPPSAATSMQALGDALTREA